MKGLRLFITMYLSLLVLIGMPVLIVTGVYHFYLILQNNPTGVTFILGFMLSLGVLSGLVAMASEFD